MEFDLTKAIVAKGDFLDDLVSLLPFSVHIKEAKNRKYIQCNKQKLSLFGFKEKKEFVGKTIKELDSFMQPFWGKEYPQYIDKLDYQTITNKEPTHDNHRIFLTYKGFVHIQNMTKIPVIGLNSNVLAIFTFSDEVTQKVNLSTLYEYYRRIYHNKKMAINFFLKHINIDKYFYTPPTDAEIKVLLTMRIYESHKLIARILKTEPKTVENQIRYIRPKLKNIELYALVSMLRTTHTTTI